MTLRVDFIRDEPEALDSDHQLHRGVTGLGEYPTALASEQELRHWHREPAERVIEEGPPIRVAALAGYDRPIRIWLTVDASGRVQRTVSRLGFLDRVAPNVVAEVSDDRHGVPISDESLIHHGRGRLRDRQGCNAQVSCVESHSWVQRDVHLFGFVPGLEPNRRLYLLFPGRAGKNLVRLFVNRLGVCAVEQTSLDKQRRAWW
jgi:hypothetical protein